MNENPAHSAFWSSELTLTDYEQRGMVNEANLSDGHASQELHDSLHEIISDLPTLWNAAERCVSEEAMAYFVASYSQIAQVGSIARCERLLACPTASNSIDIIGALLAERKGRTCLIEPTFDNLALLLRRRGVPLQPVPVGRLYSMTTEQEIQALFDQHTPRAIFVVDPNNPTGEPLSHRTLQALCSYCKVRDIILVLDNSFRLHKRTLWDTYAVLEESDVSYLAFEDTGKVFPTQELKISILTSSPDLFPLLREIYNEIYLKPSNFSLFLLSAYAKKFQELGLRQILWDIIDDRQNQLANALEGTGLIIDTRTTNSTLGVSWIDIRGTGLKDVELVEKLAMHGISVLPGRQFYWSSHGERDHQNNIRVSLLRPKAAFAAGVERFRSFSLNEPANAVWGL